MVEITVNGLVHSVSQVIQVKNFSKRELVIVHQWNDRNGTPHDTLILIEFSGERMNELNHLVHGDPVTVKAYVTGKEYQGRIYNTIRGLSVAVEQPQPYRQSYPPSPLPQYGNGYNQGHNR